MAETIIRIVHDKDKPICTPEYLLLDLFNMMTTESPFPIIKTEEAEKFVVKGPWYASKKKVDKVAMELIENFAHIATMVIL